MDLPRVGFFHPLVLEGMDLPRVGFFHPLVLEGMDLPRAGIFLPLVLRGMDLPRAGIFLPLRSRFSSASITEKCFLWNASFRVDDQVDRVPKGVSWDQPTICL